MLSLVAACQWDPGSQARTLLWPPENTELHDSSSPILTGLVPVEILFPSELTSLHWTWEMDLQGLGRIDFMCWATHTIVMSYQAMYNVQL